jgi:hypothetical protein
LQTDCIAVQAIRKRIRQMPDCTGPAAQGILRCMRIISTSLALRVALILAGAGIFHCSNSTPTQNDNAVDLTATATVTNGSADVVFASVQTLPVGTVLVFSTQPGIPYTLSTAITNATAGVLNTVYTGPSSSAATVLNANACYPDNDGINGGDYTIDLVVTDTGFYASSADAGTKELLATQNDAQVTLTLTNNGTTPHGFSVGCTSVLPAYPTLPSGCPTSACFPANATIAPIAPGTSTTVTFDTPTPDGIIYPFTSNAAADSAVPGLNEGQWSLM